MAWDSTRPVPWRRLIRDWLLYFGIMIVVFVAFFHDRMTTGTVVGLAVSGPLFVALGAVLAKLGYTRKTLRQLRSESSDPPEPRTQRSSTPTSSARNRPAPTRRTSTGPRNRPSSKRKR